ncbi:MAG TPA: hypothetical protein PKD09_19215 [Aggregatilinea sp.]|uniref:hypothetical protein n=1 Tax=Aggregatilinea sp. TaxID=2806333 RepID=UPI002D1B1AFD|nr:hypothetical protein [Aggregatilinea sp.]HML23794.1 hypothetical protein [Aggregatilinea sp.]
MKAALSLSLEITIWLVLYAVITLLTTWAAEHVFFALLGGVASGGFGDIMIGMEAICIAIPTGVVLALPATYFAYIHTFGRIFEKIEARRDIEHSQG